MFRLMEFLVVGSALSVLSVRVAGNAGYRRYAESGGKDGFWTWLSGELTKPEDAAPDASAADSPRSEASGPGTAAAMSPEAAAQRERELERRAAEVRRRLRLLDAADRRQAKAAKASKGGAGRQAAKRRKNSSSRRRGGAVKVGGASSYVAASGKTPYRVTGIRGIEFGSTDNAPGPKVRPLLSASRNEDGSLDFRSIRWQEDKALSESIYGFERARLNHTFDTEQLSSVSLHREFPKTEEGMRQALEFYKQMSGEAAADLGFEIVDVDRTGRESSAKLYEFVNRDGDTSIHGSIGSWSDKTVTVTLSVSDKTLCAEQSAQSKAAYDSGVAEAVDSRIVIVNRDLSEVKAHSLELLPDEL